MSRPNSRHDRPTGKDERWYHKVVRFLAYLVSLIGGAGGDQTGRQQSFETNPPSQKPIHVRTADSRRRRVTATTSPALCIRGAVGRTAAMQAHRREGLVGERICAR